MRTPLRAAFVLALAVGLASAADPIWPPPWDATQRVERVLVYDFAYTDREILAPTGAAWTDLVGDMRGFYRNATYHHVRMELIYGGKVRLNFASGDRTWQKIKAGVEAHQQTHPAPEHERSWYWTSPGGSTGVAVGTDLIIVAGPAYAPHEFEHNDGTGHPSGGGTGRYHPITKIVNGWMDSTPGHGLHYRPLSLADHGTVIRVWDPSVAHKSVDIGPNAVRALFLGDPAQPLSAFTIYPNDRSTGGVRVDYGHAALDATPGAGYDGAQPYQEGRPGFTDDDGFLFQNGQSLTMVEYSAKDGKLLQVTMRVEAYVAGRQSPVGLGYADIRIDARPWADGLEVARLDKRGREPQGSGAANTATLRVRRTGSGTQAITAQVQWSGGATAEGQFQDYSGNVASVTIPANAPHADVVLTPRADTYVEGPEKAILTITRIGSRDIGKLRDTTNFAVLMDSGDATANYAPTMLNLYNPATLTRRAGEVFGLFYSGYDRDGQIVRARVMTGSNTVLLDKAFHSGEPYTAITTSDQISYAVPGTHQLRIEMTDDDGAIATMAGPLLTITGGGTTPQPQPTTQQPYAGVIAIPGTVQAEQYDLGGEGVAYHDTTSGNAASTTYRAGAQVDASTSSVGWTANGEWLEYTVRIATTGTYEVAAFVAVNKNRASMTLAVDGTALITAAPLPNNRSWTSFQEVELGTVPLTAGTRILRLSIPRAGYNIDKLVFTLVPAGNG